MHVEGGGGVSPISLVYTKVLTHFRSRTEFQSTSGCGLSQPGLQSGLDVHTGRESGLELSCKQGYR